MIGTEKGEVCNRYGCCGIIKSNHAGNGCSCHINPPCSYCVSEYFFCDECGWDSEQEPSPEATKEE